MKYAIYEGNLDRLEKKLKRFLISARHTVVISTMNRLVKSSES